MIKRSTKCHEEADMQTQPTYHVNDNQRRYTLNCVSAARYSVAMDTNPYRDTQVRTTSSAGRSTVAAPSNALFLPCAQRSLGPEGPCGPDDPDTIYSERGNTGSPDKHRKIARCSGEVRSHPMSNH